jgi:UDP-N-acetyl-D-glucosamine dehydrogenase
VLIFGVAYKKDIDDVRESPAIDIIELLQSKGANVGFVDPYVSSVSVKNIELKSQELNDWSLNNSDIGIVVTDHSCYDWDTILTSRILVILDTRNSIKITDKRVVKM